MNSWIGRWVRGHCPGSQIFLDVILLAETERGYLIGNSMCDQWEVSREGFIIEGLTPGMDGN